MAPLSSITAHLSRMDIQNHNPDFWLFRNNLDAAEEKYIQLGLLYHAIYQLAPVNFWPARDEDAFTLSPHDTTGNGNLQLLQLYRLHDIENRLTRRLVDSKEEEFTRLLKEGKLILGQFREDLCVLETRIEGYYDDARDVGTGVCEEWRMPFDENICLKAWLGWLPTVRREVEEGKAEQEVMIQVITRAEEDTRDALLWKHAVEVESRAAKGIGSGKMVPAFELSLPVRSR